jgi:hypothetical protein
MSETLDDKFFDYAFQVLNYAIEFVKSPGYSSLRLTDVLEKTVNLGLEIEGVERKEFYKKIKETFGTRKLLSSSMNREEFLDRLLSEFVEEWRKEG